MYQDRLNPQDLPTLQEVTQVIDQLWAYARPLAPGKLYVWINSTKVNQVREIAITVRLSPAQATVDATIGKHEQFTKALPPEAVHVYTYNFDRKLNSPPVKNNCLKLFYRSSK